MFQKRQGNLQSKESHSSKSEQRCETSSALATQVQPPIGRFDKTLFCCADRHLKCPVHLQKDHCYVYTSQDEGKPLLVLLLRTTGTSCHEQATIFEYSDATSEVSDQRRGQRRPVGAAQGCVETVLWWYIGVDDHTKANQNATLPKLDHFPLFISTPRVSWQGQGEGLSIILYSGHYQCVVSKGG